MQPICFNAVTFQIRWVNENDSLLRTLLQTEQQFPGIDNKREGPQNNGDGSVIVYFRPPDP